MFKRMALLKPQASAWSIFSEKPQAKGETVMLESVEAEPAVEFTFEMSVPVAASVSAPALQLAAAKKTSKAAQRKKNAVENSEEQLLLFKIA